MEELISNLIDFLFGAIMLLSVLSICVTFMLAILRELFGELQEIRLPTFKKKIKTRTISETEHLEYERLKKEHKAAQEELEQVINSK